MIYYRVALRESKSPTWRWKSSPLTSLHDVLGLLKLYRCVSDEHIRPFRSTSPDQMEAMPGRANQGLLSTAISIDQLYDKHAIGRIQVRRLEIELGPGGDHDCPYTWSLPPSAPHTLAWVKLLARRARAEFEP